MSEIEKIIDKVQAEWVVCGLGSGTLYGDLALEVTKRATAELRAALREALEDWEGWMPTKRSSSTLAEKGRARIAALRARFLDDK